MNPQLSDQAVADLPLQAGRAELLEEIMRTPVLDHPTTESRPAPRRNHWLVPVAAAAVVAVVATGPLWWASPDAAPGDVDFAGVPAVAQGSGYRAVLDAPGWTVDNVEESEEHGGGISYRKGDWWLEVTWSPADSYDSYVEDREDIVDPPAPGEPVDVLGAAGQLWAYSGHDHTVIREVQRDHWMEIRAQGPDRAGYLALLERLRLVDGAGFEAALPASYVVSGERQDQIGLMLTQIEEVSGAGLPDGAGQIRSVEADPYHLGADVAGGYACAWITTFAHGDAEARAQAQDVLATARDWPVLLEMAERGAYPEVLWDDADEVAAGRVPEGFEGGLGC